MAILKAKEFSEKLIKSIDKFEANKIKNIQVIWNNLAYFINKLVNLK